jgi:nicotinate-nucleotide pyrophosphorylase (carboxylating)
MTQAAMDTLTAHEYEAFRKLIAFALEEDVGPGDATTLALVPENAQAVMLIAARQELRACGAGLLTMVFEALGGRIKTTQMRTDGEHVKKGEALARLEGNARQLLTGERVALNLLQRLCGVATLTARYVEEICHTKAVILDTRKTMPGMRLPDKYAVRAGGGKNHRVGLYDMILIKDNHIALCGGITQAVQRARKYVREHMLPLEVECDTLAQVEEALSLSVERILLDNMTLEQLRQAVALNAGRTMLEASGGVSLDNVRAIAETGVDAISVGALTHSAIAADIGADIVLH